MKEHDLVPIRPDDLAARTAAYVERAKAFAEKEDQERRAYVVPKMKARRLFGLTKPLWTEDREPTDAEVLKFGDAYWPTYWPGRSFLEFAKSFQTRMQNMIDISEGKDILLSASSASELARDPAKMTDPWLRW